MSASQVLTTVRAALKDEATGLAAKVAELKAADSSLVRVNTAYNWIRWSLADRLATTTAPNVAVSVRGAQTELKLSTYPTRDAAWRMEVSGECFEADQGAIEDWATTTATALLMVLDGLREYSDANAGTILEVMAQPGQPSVSLDFGDFQAGTVQSFGFICRFTVLERSTT